MENEVGVIEAAVLAVLGELRLGASLAVEGVA